MEWPFEINAASGAGGVRGVAEIVGKRSGLWQVGQVYIANSGAWRHAGYDEHRTVELSLQMWFGGAIGRAYRRSLEREVRRDPD